MGVDAEYLYGYMAEVEDVEWDFDLLRGKSDLNRVVSKWSDETYGDLINGLENDNVEDWHVLADELGFIYESTQYDGQYLYFTHSELAKKYPDGKLSDLDDLAKEYARECGVKNVEIFKWDEFGYFD